MKKFLLSSLLGVFLLGFGGISVATVSNPYGSITYTLNGDTETQYEAKFITIDTGETVITILDRNLGATTNNVNSSDSRGFHFQWGNNYGFNSSTTPAYSTTQVSANNITLPYSSNIFIKESDNWLDDNNKVDLWGGTTGDGNNYFELTEEQAELRQGPCPDNWHVPTAGELSKMIELMGTNKSEIYNKLKIPYAGYRNSNTNTIANNGSTAYLWSSSPVENSSSSRAFYMWYENDDREPDMTAGSDRADGYSIRCFYNYNTGIEFVISGINFVGPESVADGDDWLYDWTIYTTDNTYTTGHYSPVQWNGTAWTDATQETASGGVHAGFKIVLTSEEGYTFSENPTINYNGTAWINSGNTTFDSETNTLYIDLGIVGEAPIEIEHILLIGDLGRFVHGTTPPTDITTNTTGINLGAVTWGKGSSCTPLEANETFVSSSNYNDYYCLTIPFTVDTGYVLRNNYYIYRKNIGADRSTDRVYASDEEYACTPSEIKIKYLYAVHTVNFIVDGQPRDETRYRRNGCPLYGCNGYYASLRAPTKEGYIFEGWYTEDTFVNKLNWYSSGVTENMTLYANWINKINTITISGVTVPTSGAQATLSGIEKSADPITGVNWGTLVWKIPTNDNSEDPQPVDFDGIFQGGKSYRLYVPFTIAEGYGIQKGYSNTTIFTVNGTQKDINYDIGCSNSSCSAWLSYYVPYIITFYDGETVYTTGTAYGGDTINYTWSITNPYVPGKKFLGWFKDPEFTQQRRLDTDTVTGDMNLYGKFANQLMNVNLTGVVAPEGNVSATVAGISLAEGTSGVQLGTLKWKEGESDFNGKYVSGTQYTLYVPFKLIDDYVMPDYYSYVSFSVNGEYFYKEIGATGNEDYPYYIRTYFTATAPGNGASEPTSSAGGSSGGGGGGGGRIIVTNDKQETEVKNDENNKQEENKSEEKQENNTENPENTQNDSQKVLEDGLTQEFHDAYDFAYKNGITTMDNISKANMNGPLTRIAMAKMLSNYAINVLGKKPANKVVPKFPDVDEKLNEDYGGAVDLAYQLGIMGINIDEFRPFDPVDRKEFGTALSRMLFGIADGDKVYYETHLKKLKEEGIITNDNPNLQEARGYVMIMLMRSAK